MERLDPWNSVSDPPYLVGFLGEKMGISGISWWNDWSQLNPWNCILDPPYLDGVLGRKWEFEGFLDGIA